MEADDRVVGDGAQPSRGTLSGWDRKRKMARHELETGLCELGSRIWEAIQSDDAIADTLFKLVDMKLALDHVTLDDFDVSIPMRQRRSSWMSKTTRQI